MNRKYDNWVGFEAAHIVPLAFQGYWNTNNSSRWVTIPTTGGEPMNSVQNGLLLRSDLHRLFDSYQVSINPDVRMTLISSIVDTADCARITIKSSVFGRTGKT